MPWLKFRRLSLGTGHEPGVCRRVGSNRWGYWIAARQRGPERAVTDLNGEVVLSTTIYWPYSVIISGTLYTHPAKSGRTLKVQNRSRSHSLPSPPSQEYNRHKKIPIGGGSIEQESNSVDTSHCVMRATQVQNFVSCFFTHPFMCLRISRIVRSFVEKACQFVEGQLTLAAVKIIHRSDQSR
jgi:hypothetical protein